VRRMDGPALTGLHIGWTPKLWLFKRDAQKNLTKTLDRIRRLNSRLEEEFTLGLTKLTGHLEEFLTFRGRVLVVDIVAADLVFRVERKRRETRTSEVVFTCCAFRFKHASERRRRPDLSTTAAWTAEDRQRTVVSVTCHLRLRLFRLG
jgi:hypothetical protein